MQHADRQDLKRTIYWGAYIDTGRQDWVVSITALCPVFEGTRFRFSKRRPPIQNLFVTFRTPKGEKLKQYIKICHKPPTFLIHLKMVILLGTIQSTAENVLLHKLRIRVYHRETQTAGHRKLSWNKKTEETKINDKTERHRGGGGDGRQVHEKEKTK
jgi:hypothetical protein